MEQIYMSHWEDVTKNILSDVQGIDRATFHQFLHDYREYNNLLDTGYDSINDFINYVTYLHIIVCDYMQGKIKFDREKQVFYIIKRVELFSQNEQIVQ